MLKEMKREEELAELVGIILGDGSLYFNKKKGIYQFVITGHIKNDREYLERFVLPLLERNFGKKFELVYNKRRNVIRIRTQKSKIVKKISSLGIPFGNKLKNNIEIPNWVFSRKNLIKACIRGLIDTDGSVSPITGRNYSYIWFVSQIPALRMSFSEAMKVLDIKTSKWNERTEHGSQIFIGSKADLQKYFKEINFNNPYHKERFMAPIV